MSLTNQQLDQLLEIAKKAALSAGEMILEHHGKITNVQMKETGSSIQSQVVTEVDLKAEKIILDMLYPTLKEYQLGLLSEETTDDHSRFECDYFWCIDPLDGTYFFANSMPGYAVSIALVSRQGKAILGIVYDPFHRNLYYACKNKGAFKNNLPFQYEDSQENLKIFHDHSFLAHPETESILEKVKIDHPKLTLEIAGGAVLHALLTIEKGPALYFKIPKEVDGGGSVWDFTATAVIQREAGGFNGDYRGKPLNLNSKETTYMNGEGVFYASTKELFESTPKVV